MITKGFAISENFNYIFTPKGVVKVSNEENNPRFKKIIPYTMDNIDIAFNILKENLLCKYQNKKMDLVEYSNYPRKVLYKMVEIFKPSNNLSIISEWEKKYGNKLLLINESTDKSIILERVNNSINHIKTIVEQWYNPFSKDFVVAQAARNVKDAAVSAGKWVVDQGKQIGEKGLLNYVGEKAKSAWNYISNGIASAWNCVTSGVECIMEGIRSMLFSAVGVGIMAGFSTLIPVVGQIANAVLYGALLIWDIYKMLSGKYESGKYQWSYLDIFMDIIAMIPSMQLIAKSARTVFAGARSFLDIGKIAAKQGGVFAGMVNAIRGGINTVIGLIAQAASFFGNTLGIKWLADWGGKTTAKVKQFVDDLAAGAKGGTQTTTSIVKNLKQKLKQIWAKELTQKGGTLGQAGKTTLSAAVKHALFCAAMGVDNPITCREKEQANEFTAEQKANAKVEVDKAMAEMAKEMGGSLDNVELTGEL